MKLPITKIAELTGIHRDTISKRLADLPFEAGKKGAKLYSSEDALDSRGSVELSFFRKLGLAIQFPPQGSHAEQSETKQRNCQTAIGNIVWSR